LGDTIIIGDIHGYYDNLVRVLKWDVHLIDEKLSWIGGDTTLCFLGDYCDRGPDGIGTFDLIMKLQQQASDAGGKVIALLGNHDVMILAAHRFGYELTGNMSGSFMGSWKRFGGRIKDIENLTPTHIEWLTNLPAMSIVDERLLVHADSLFYAHYGNSIDEVNRSTAKMLKSDDATIIDIMLGYFGDRYAFTEYDWNGLQRANYTARAEKFLSIFGGKQIIHAHTPIFRMSDQIPELVTEALIYANGLCVNLDPGMYRGGPGFAHILSPLK